MAKRKATFPSSIPSYSLENFRPIHRIESQAADFGYNQIDASQHIPGFELYSSVGMKAGLGPLKSEFYRVSMTVSGTTDIQLGLEEYTTHPGTVFFTCPNQIFSKLRISEDIFGYYLLFKADFLAPLIPATHLGAEFPFLDYAGTPLFQLSSEETRQFESFLFRINDELRHNKPGKAVAIRLYLYLLLLDAKRSYQRQGLDRTQEPFDAGALVSRFRKLVGQHFLTKRQVADYAALLHISPNHLNRIVKEQTGHTASQTIAHMLLQESKALLRCTGLSVSEISYQLDFSDPASFNRFFKKSSGLTPLEFRTRA